MGLYWLAAVVLLACASFAFSLLSDPATGDLRGVAIVVRATCAEFGVEYGHFATWREILAALQGNYAALARPRERAPPPRDLAAKRAAASGGGGGGAPAAGRAAQPVSDTESESTSSDDEPPTPTAAAAR